MDHGLSPLNKLYLEQVVAGGLFPSKEAALDAAVAALRAQAEEIPFVPDEHMQAVEQGLDEADADVSDPMTAEDWSRLRQRVRDVAAGKHQGDA